MKVFLKPLIISFLNTVAASVDSMTLDADTTVDAQEKQVIKEVVGIIEKKIDVFLALFLK